MTCRTRNFIMAPISVSLQEHHVCSPHRVCSFVLCAIFLLVPLGLSAQESVVTTDELEYINSLSGDEMLASAQNHLAQMSEIMDHSFTLMEETREEGADFVIINCVSEKISAIKGFVNVSEQSFRNLQESLARGEMADARHQFSLIVIASQKVEGLGMEADQCAGEILHYVGDTKVTKKIDPDIAGVDPTDEEREEHVDRLEEGTPYQ